MSDWRADLAAARQPPTEAQTAWDRQWRRWQDIALRAGRSPNEAVVIADTRTTDQLGDRPAEETT